MRLRRIFCLLSALAAAVPARTAEPLVPRAAGEVLLAALAHPLVPAAIAPAVVAAAPAAAAPKLTIDVSNVDLSGKRLRPHYAAAVQRVREFVQESRLAFPTEDIEITIHPGIAHPGPAGALLSRRDKIAVTVPYRWIHDSSLHPSKSHPEGLYTKHPVHTLPVFYHELGHAVFRQNAETTDSPFGEQFRLVRREQELALRGFELLGRIERAQDERELAALQTELEPAKAEYDAVRAAMARPRFKRQAFTLDALDEFFADVTPVLVARNPRTMSDVQRIAAPDNKSQLDRDRLDSLSARDFSDPRNAARAPQKWPDAHEYLSPARYALYERFLRHSPLIGRDRGAVYDQVFAAVIRASHALRESALPDQAAMNARLISELSR